MDRLYEAIPGAAALLLETSPFPAITIFNQMRIRAKKKGHKTIRLPVTLAYHLAVEIDKLRGWKDTPK